MRHFLVTSVLASVGLTAVTGCGAATEPGETSVHETRDASIPYEGVDATDVDRGDDRRDGDERADENETQASIDAGTPPAPCADTQTAIVASANDKLFLSVRAGATAPWTTRPRTTARAYSRPNLC